jgi:hypothetical protein
MRKITAYLLFLSLSLLGCSTVTTIGGFGGYHFPTQKEGGELGIKIKSGSGVEKEVVSVDQGSALPIQTSLEPRVFDEMPIPQTVAIALIILSIVRDAINSIPISIGSIF